MSDLECGHESFGCSEQVMHCGFCDSFELIKSLGIMPEGIFAREGYPCAQSYHIDLYCGHKQRRMSWAQTFGKWCPKCRVWRPIKQEKEMTWNKKKRWKVYDVEADLCTHGYSTSSADADEKAQHLASTNKRTYLVMVSESGFEPKTDTQKVKFEK